MSITRPNTIFTSLIVHSSTQFTGIDAFKLEKVAQEWWPHPFFNWPYR